MLDQDMSNNTNNSVKEIIRATFSDGVTAFFKVRQKKWKVTNVSSNADSCWLETNIRGIPIISKTIYVINI